ncbi:MAG TPA: phosphomannomutase/phosphoglucomutase [Gammaproteobacteria bacterium]|nr:phosphomannomutase/phosphoglucomutase [Gammaproteobacteria bacterium]
MSDFLFSTEIFRAYDIRGVVNKSLTIEIVEAIGRALGTTVLTRGETAIVVARDGRLSGPLLIDALSKGILATGCNVVDIGMVPTPVLYFATHYLRIPSGVMITGSHNPPDYNGLKMMVGGQALYGDGIQALAALIKKLDFCKGQGQKTEQNIVESYVQAIKKDVRLSRPLKIVVDAGNGVTGDIIPVLFEALGCTVIPLFCEVDGHFPNHHPDPGQPKNLVDLISAVHAHQADIGLAFDGDGDRLGVVDNLGKIIWPDRQLILFAKEILKKHVNATIIYDVKCTRHVNAVVKSLGGQPLMWKTGHSLIKAKMQETGALLAGEMSGHLFFKDRWFGFDDALYAGARLLEILSEKNKEITVSEIFSTLPDSVNTPELQISVTEQTKFERVERLIALAQFPDAIISTIDGLRVDFKDGFGLVRPSNTGPNLILRFEGDTAFALQRIQSEFRQLLLDVDPLWELPF